jgi:GNAT superfamily N-acetyltransferase
MPDVRPARLSDAQRIARLTSQLGYEVGVADVAERISRILSRPGDLLVVAEVDGHVVGWAHGAVWDHIETGAFVRIGGLVVDDRHRRHGIGRALMAEIEEWARRQGCPTVRLWSSAARTASHEFYERLGYKNIKTQHSFVKLLERGSGDLERLVPRIGRSAK